MSKRRGRGLRMEDVRQRGVSVEAIVVCVDYGDYLERTLPLFARTADRTIVVSLHRDDRTRRIAAAQPNVALVETDASYRDGARFNKGAAINAGLNAAVKRAWVLHIDADIIVLDPIPTDLDRTVLWTAVRHQVVGERRWKEALSGDREGLHAKLNVFRGRRLAPCGYFQLWRWPTTGRYYPEGHEDAGWSDLEFSAGWPRNKRAFIPGFDVYHLETEDHVETANWRGRTTDEFH